MNGEGRMSIETSRVTVKVLRPPGGTSSNIFGAPTTADTGTPKKPDYNKSNIFGVESGAPQGQGSAATQAAAPAAAKQDTGDRIFGDTEAKATPPQKSQGGFNPITHEAKGDNSAANLHTSTRVKQPPGGASTPLW